MDGDRVRGNDSDDFRNVEAPSGWVSTKQAAKFLGVSPRTVRWHIEQGNLVANTEGEGVKRSWLVSMDSLQAFRDAQQSAGELPRGNRTFGEGADIALENLGNPIRELADRLAEEAASAAEYRVRLEIAEQAQSTLEEELAAERVRREQAERERDELRLMLEGRSGPPGSRETALEEPYSTHDAPPTPQHPVERPSWWRRFFGFE